MTLTCVQSCSTEKFREVDDKKELFLTHKIIMMDLLLHLLLCILIGKPEPKFLSLNQVKKKKEVLSKPQNIGEINTHVPDT